MALCELDMQASTSVEPPEDGNHTLMTDGHSAENDVMTVMLYQLQSRHIEWRRIGMLSEA
jgi:hypothetical protein